MNILNETKAYPEEVPPWISEIYMKIYSYLKLTFLYLISIVKIRKVIRIQTKFEYCANSTFT